MSYTIETLKSIGGSEWQKGEMHRAYFNDLADWYGLDCSYYNSGNICSARLDGDKISNNAAKQIVSRLAFGKLWYDMTDGQFHGKNIEQRDFNTIVKAIKSKLETVQIAEVA